MFKIQLPFHVSQAGWHIAHIFDAKDRNVNYRGWDRAELLRQTARNIHPCNYFYVPKTDWQKYGGDARVIAFFYEKFKALYSAIWDDLLRLVGGQPLPDVIGTGFYPYVFTKVKKAHYFAPEVIRDSPIRPSKIEYPMMATGPYVATYEFYRLCFRAEVIEPLDLDDRFCVVTPEGTFAMSKREFYETFPNVVESQNYRLKKIYHYPTTPQKAMRFKIM
jgi:hypothetical protein